MCSLFYEEINNNQFYHPLAKAFPNHDQSSVDKIAEALIAEVQGEQFKKEFHDYTTESLNGQVDAGSDPTWGSKGLFKIHQMANTLAVARNTGGTLDKKHKNHIKALNAATVYSDGDRYQTGEYSYRHGMRNSSESVQEAKTKADQYVRFQFASARRLLANGDEYNAYFTLGLGLHVLQDATSPAHGGFQIWSGRETEY